MQQKRFDDDGGSLRGHSEGPAGAPVNGRGESLSPRVRVSIETAAVQQLFEQFVIAGAVNLMLIAFVTVSLWGHAPASLLLGWAAAGTAVIGVRFLLHHHYRRTRNPDPATWSQRHLVLTALSGLLWGIAAPLFVPQIPAPQALVLVIAIAGIVAGALPVNAAVLRVYLVYLLVTISPVAVTFFLMGDRNGMILGTMAVLYGLAMSASGRNYSRNLAQAYELSARLNEVNRELERRASHDALTGLWNRHRFEIALDEELDRIARYGSTCALIMLDIDHFKQINDTFGHDVGDRVLTQLGAILGAEIRSPDRAARWGGEEFMILLPETGLTAGAWAAERLRRHVAVSGFEGPERITTSLGVTVCDGQEQRSDLLKRLDDALYRAKQQGRNRVESVDMPTGTGSLF